MNVLALIIVCVLGSKALSSWLASLLVSGSEEAESTIFSEDYCSQKCGDVTHTMCEPESTVGNCSPFEYHHLPDRTLKVLVEGHNGLRNRIAERMGVSHMLEMTWDAKLATMALNFLLKCEHQGLDPCTAASSVIVAPDIASEFYNSSQPRNKTILKIAQNSYHETSEFFPVKFFERMIRSWYFEKEAMQKPILSKTPQLVTMGSLAGENNFTHLAFPWAHRFGCAMAKFNGSFAVVCNYYPYYRTETNVVFYRSGPVASDCPPRFPLIDEMFSNLCTNDADQFMAEGAASEIKLRYRNVLLFLSAVVFVFSNI